MYLRKQSSVCIAALMWGMAGATWAALLTWLTQAG